MAWRNYTHHCYLGVDFLFKGLEGTCIEKRKYSFIVLVENKLTDLQLFFKLMFPFHEMRNTMPLQHPNPVLLQPTSLIDY